MTRVAGSGDPTIRSCRQMSSRSNRSKGSKGITSVIAKDEWLRWCREDMVREGRRAEGGGVFFQEGLGQVRLGWGFLGGNSGGRFV